MRTDKLKKYLIPNIPYLFILCLLYTSQGYKKLSTPNFSYGDIYGYELTSADILPITMAAAGGKILIMGVLLESNQLVMELYDIKSDTWSQAPLLDDLEIFGDLNYPLYSMAGGLSKIYLHYITTTGQQKFCLLYTSRCV